MKIIVTEIHICYLPISNNINLIYMFGIVTCCTCNRLPVKFLTSSRGMEVLVPQLIDRHAHKDTHAYSDNKPR